MSHNTYMDHAMNDYTNSIKNIRSSSSSSGGGDGGITDDDQAMMMTMMSGSTTATPASADQDYQEDEDQALTDLRRGPWTVEEDLILINYIANHGEGRWNSLARCAGLKRTGKSCRLRWLNYLRPDVRRGNITLEEQLLILELHSRWGNRWSKIAQYLPGRTDNEIKNYWRTRVQKHAKQLKCDVNSKQFKDTMRYLWMPRLVERIQAAAATAATNPPAKSNGGGAHAPAAASENMTTYAQHLLQSSAAAGSEHFMSDVPTATTTAPPPPPPTITAAKTTPHHHQLSVNSNITPENSGGSTSTDHDSSSFGTQVGVGLSLADHLSSDFTVPALTPAPNAIGAADHYYSSFHNYLHNDGSSNNNINNNHHDYYSVNHNYNREDYSAGGGGGGAYASIVDSLTSPATSCGNYLVNQHHQGSAAGFEEYYVPAASVAAGTAASMFHQNVDSNGAAAAPPPSTSYNNNNNINMSTGTSTSEWYVGGRGSCGSGGDAYDSFWNVDEDIFLLQQQFNVV